MTVQVDSQPVTDQIMWYIDMFCINNSISCLEKKTDNPLIIMLSVCTFISTYHYSILVSKYICLL